MTVSKFCEKCGKMMWDVQPCKRFCDTCLKEKARQKAKLNYEKKKAQKQGAISAMQAKKPDKKAALKPRIKSMESAVFDGESLLRHNVDLVADNGDRAYGTVQDFVFILTCDEYRKYRDYIPNYYSWIWTATPWYCGDGDYSSYTCHAVNVRCVGRGGLLDKNGANYSCAVAPACILNPKSLNLRQSMAYVEEVSE